MEIMIQQEEKTLDQHFDEQFGKLSGEVAVNAPFSKCGKIDYGHRGGFLLNKKGVLVFYPLVFCQKKEEKLAEHTTSQASELRFQERQGQKQNTETRNLNPGHWVAGVARLRNERGGVRK